MKFQWMTLLLLSLFSVTIGCQETTPNDGPPASTETYDDHDHAHPTSGPHNGDLVELGNEEYHAELVHDQANQTLNVYILDSTATSDVAIDASQITINLQHDGQPEQFPLEAVHTDGDNLDKTSWFQSRDAELMEHLHEEGTAPKLVLTINGKSYRGTIAHDHGHDHQDGEHKH